MSNDADVPPVIPISPPAPATEVSYVRYAYNGFGQEVSEKQFHGGSGYSDSNNTVQYAYDTVANGSRLTSMTYPNGRVEDYIYSSGIDSVISRISAIADDYNYEPSECGPLPPLTVQSYSYLGLDTIVNKRDGNGVELTYTTPSGETGLTDGGDRYTGLDRFGRVIDQNWYNTGTSSSNERFQYGYDQDGNVLYKKNLASGGSSFSELYHANSSESGDDSSAYDGLGQLQGFRRGTLSSSGNNAGPDTVTTGNLNTIVGDNSTTYSLDALGNQTSSVNSRNQLTATHFAYDNNGNMKEDGSANTYVYDAWNRLMYENSGATYTYDALGRLIGEGLDGSNREDNFYSADGHIIEEHSHYCTGATDHEILNQYVWGIGGTNDLVLRDNNNDPDIGAGEALGMADSGLDNRDYAEQDANGNVTAVVALDGTVENHFVYDNYGAVQVVNGSYTATTSLFDNWNILFQGEKQQDNGMYLMGVRFYNTGTNTWMQPEPSGASYIDGMNLYQADDSNPVALSDPSGMAGFSLSGFVGSAASLAANTVSGAADFTAHLPAEALNAANDAVSIVFVGDRGVQTKKGNPTRCPSSSSVVVHYWYPSINPLAPGGVGVGHVSMTIMLPDGTTVYISDFPQKPAPASPMIPNNTLENDTNGPRGEKTYPRDYVVPNMDTEAINKWWIQYQKNNPIWKAAGPNCATTVAVALTVGGAKGMPSKRQVFMPMDLPPYLNNIASPPPTTRPK